MSHSGNAVYLHYVWGTYNREQLITEQIAGQIYAVMCKVCMDNDAQVLAIGGIADHVHLLVKFPSEISIAALIKKIKGSSSHFVTHTINPVGGFRWQVGYGVASVSMFGVPNVVKYINHQAERHRQGHLIAELEID